MAGSTEGCVGANCARGTTGERGGGSTSPGSGRASGASSGSSSGSSTVTLSAGGSSSGGASTFASTSAESTAAGGSSSGSGGGNGDCGGISLPDGGGCPHGSFVAQLVDALTCAPIVGATVQAIDANTVPVPGSVTTASDGTFVLCGAPDGPFTPFVTATGYETMYYAEFQGDANNSLNFIEGIAPTDLEALGSFLPGGYNANQGLILATFTPGQKCDASGWSVALTDADGGTISTASYQVAYMGTQGFPQSGLSVTTAAGSALIYDIDLSTTNFFGVKSLMADGGLCAPQLVADGAALTGRLYVTVSSVTVDVLLLP